MLWILEVACSAHVCGIILGRVQGWNQWCILYYDPIVECHTKEHSMFVATAVSAPNVVEKTSTKHQKWPKFSP